MPAPPFTALDEQSCVLLREAAQHDDEHERAAIQNRVIEMNLPLAHRMASRYRNKGVADEDLEQVARLGVLKAVRRFDPARPSFAAFAVPTVLGELRRYFRDNAWVVKPSRQIQVVQSAAMIARDELRVSSAREPTTHEVAVQIGAPDEAVREAESVQGAFTPRSLDVPGPVTGRTPADMMGGDDVDLETMERLVAAAPAVRHLSGEDRQLLRMRYIEERTQQDIGAELGISQMQVSRRLTAVIGRIRHEMGLVRACCCGTGGC